MQRRWCKLRYVIGQPVVDDRGWVCYFDDDVVVNISNLVLDLEAKRPLCQPNCFIAVTARRRNPYGTSEYSWPFTVWCMQAQLIRRLQREFLPKPDTHFGIDNLTADDFALGQINAAQFRCVTVSQ